jgi:hypothetical protein
VPRRLLPSVAVLLAVGLACAGCADDVAPAATAGDLTITHDELMDEVAEWARSPRLVQLVAGPEVTAGGAGHYDAGFVSVVLQNRLSFDVFGEEFDSLGLELDPNLVEEVRAGLFPDPADAQQVLDELDPDFANRLVADVARQFQVQTELQDAVVEFGEEAFGDVEINPRYGSWDTASRVVVPPEGPRSAPGDELTFEL